MSDILNSLIKISHLLGRDPMLVQGGGGNTSVKTPDKREMYIKASGTAMADMDREKGWARVSIEKVLATLSDSQLFELPVQDREKRVLGMLSQSVIEPQGARPSVETALHAMLYNVVMHSHAVYANALTCSPDGEATLKSISKTEKLPGLWVPYTDPGFTLAADLEKKINKYVQEHGAKPNAIFLENHGFFYSADTVEDCVAGHAYWLEKIKQHINIDLVFDGATTINEPLKILLQERLTNAWSRFDISDPVIIFCEGREFSFAAAHPEIFRGGLSPVHIVYMGPEGVEATDNADVGELDKAIATFVTGYNMPPKLVVVKNNGICVIGKNKAAAEAAKAMVLAAAQIYKLAGKKMKHVSREHVDFLLGWEAEHYRANHLKS